MGYTVVRLRPPYCVGPPTQGMESTSFILCVGGPTHYGGRRATV